MVTPIMLIASALGIAFLLPVVSKMNKTAAQVVSLAGLTGILALSVALFFQLIGQQGQALIEQTAGFKAPLSINLRIGMEEGLGLLLVNALAFPVAFFFLNRKEKTWSAKEQALFFTLLMGLNGLLMTRDLFNLFVFLEVSSISLFGLLSTGSDNRIFEGGFKYMLAGGVASSLYLIGIAFLYQKTGSLNLDSIMERGELSGLYLPLLLLLSGVLIELKPFPANGWALDTYQAADKGMGALISGLNTTVLLLVLLKLLPFISLASPGLIEGLKMVGGVTFLLSNLAGIRQKNTNRMLGYSSIAQTGLIIFVFSLVPSMASAMVISLVFLANHALSKTSLFWLSKVLESKTLRRFTKDSSLRNNRFLLITLGIFISALTALPPLPAFWAKWELISGLQASGQILWVVIILLGSLFEIFYLFRWFIALQAHREDDGETFEASIPDDFPVEKNLPEQSPRKKIGLEILSPIFSLLLLTAFTFVVAQNSFPFWNLYMWIPLAGVIVFSLLDLIGLPLWIKNLVAITSLAFYGYLIIPSLDGVNFIFGLIFLGGSLVQLFVFFNRKKDKAKGLLPLLMGMIFSLGNLLIFKSKLGFFLSWEWITLFSFFLILRGKHSSGAGLRYLIFSLSGAFLILIALTLIPYNDLQGVFSTLGNPAVPILLGLGFLMKMGALGLHIWLPASYSESEDEISSLLSSVLSKAGLYMLFLTASFYLTPVFSTAVLADKGSLILSLMGWIGVLTALMGAFMALFQEDIKYTLAYSSMSQIGYMILGFAVASHLGWVSSLYLAVTHLLFKGLLFLAIGGVIMRTKTRLMYQMGGLIKQMPLSFIAVLMAIIALSGVPPLTGFGGKWLLYTSLLEKGWYLQAGLAMFASGIAFLYLFRLIHSIFLGQPKPALSHVKEAPFWGFIPQFIFMGLIMLFSMYPNLLIQPLQTAIEIRFPIKESGIWDGATVLSSMGYWNGSAVMYVTMGVFILPLIWLTLVQGRSQRVKQFNIVYSAERPYKPETTHYSFNFFSHYKKALGFLSNARSERFWLWIKGSIETLAGAVRRIYSGNGQTYVLHLFIFVLLLHLFSGGLTR